MAVTYCTTSDVFRVAGLDSTNLPSPMVEANVTSHILEAEAYIDRICNTTFTSTAVTETYDGNDRQTLMLRRFPVISLTTLTIQDTSVTVGRVAVYTGIEGAGQITLKSTAEETTFKTGTDPQGISITYNYGYATVPTTIQRATANLAARMTLTQQVGGTYDDLSSFTLPELGGTIGQAYINIREAFNALQKEWDTTIFPYLPKALPMA